MPPSHNTDRRATDWTDVEADLTELDGRIYALESLALQPHDALTQIGDHIPHAVGGVGKVRLLNE